MENRALKFFGAEVPCARAPSGSVMTPERNSIHPHFLYPSNRRWMIAGCSNGPAGILKSKLAALTHSIASITAERSALNTLRSQHILRDLPAEKQR
jgi:hypothetical protein